MAHVAPSRRGGGDEGLPELLLVGWLARPLPLRIKVILSQNFLHSVIGARR